MKIAIITTLRHNIGDDFIREGIIFLLKQHFGQHISCSLIHKHSPITSRYGFEWFRYNRLAKWVDRYLPLSLAKDRILEADLVVQSGAPIFWHNEQFHCADNEWFGPLVERRMGKSKRQPKFINLAGGSAQRFASDGSEFLECSKCNPYIKKLYGVAAAMSVRDKIAEKILQKLGVTDVPVLPCSSIFAINELNIPDAGQEFVVINYMKNGSHFTFGQDIDHAHWESAMQEFYRYLKAQGEKVVFSCHNQAEVEMAKTITQNTDEIFFSEDYHDYLHLYAKAKMGIMNRIHGGFPIASFGKPAIIIGTDTRIKMTDLIGIPHRFVNEADFPFLKATYHDFLGQYGQFKANMQAVKETAKAAYLQLLEKV